MFELTEDTFTLYAIKNYDNPSCKGLEEFQDDLKRFSYLKRLLRKYSITGEIKERLILNHLIVLYNLFGPEAATKMLFLKTEKEFWPQLKTFLTFLNLMPVGPITVNNVVIHGYEIPVDESIANTLGKL